MVGRKKNNNDRNRDRIIDRKWEQIFDEYNVLESIHKHGSYVISSAEINKFKQARLMTKFDYVTALPDIFFENNLSILPISRGTYIIGYFEAYQSLRTTDDTMMRDRKEIRFPDWVETISTKNITSESTMLNAANVGGMIADLFNEDEVVQTVSGRMSSGRFSFFVDGKSPVQNYELNVNNSQVEIDGGYETPDKLILFEAKNNTTNSFLIRQLYYPYQLWAKQVNKEVVPVFLQYSNETFNFSVYEFEDVNDYNSLRLITRQNYIFGAEHTTLDELAKIQKEVKIVIDNESFPFPQANTFTRVIGVIDAIRESEDNAITLEDLTLLNDFVMRQAQYYSRAAMYLGLIIQQPDHTYTLSPVGRRYVQVNRKQRNLLIARRVLEHKPFNMIFRESLRKLSPLNQREAFDILIEADYYGNDLSQTTRWRRAGTIASWVRYLFSMVDDY